MPTCPICQRESPDGTDVCPGCGVFRFRPTPEAAQTLTEAPVVTPADPGAGPAGYVAESASKAPSTEPDPELINTPVTTPLPTIEKASDPAPPPPAAPAFRLVVVRGERVNAEFAVYPGKNVVGRTADKPVDIDLTGQEPPDQVWSSRRHAVVTLDKGVLAIEDLNSLNGTFVNYTRLESGKPRRLNPGDLIAVGVVQLKVVV